MGLLAVFLWSYEALALWDRPEWTAWIVVGYLVAALVVDGIFAGAPFCKFVCPIGQFNFVQSLMAPWEIKPLRPALCAGCTTHDCIRGNASAPGCPTGLFVPHKSGNMDCTLCLDCVRACPQQNVGLLFSGPIDALVSDGLRSGIGRFSRRRDIAALILLLVFGAFANAAGMVAPMVDWLDGWRTRLGNPSLLWITTAYYVIALGILPGVLVVSVAMMGRRCGHVEAAWQNVAARYAYALVPLGFTMWLAHYGFHLATSYGTLVPAMQRFAADGGWKWLGAPHWQFSCCTAAADWIVYAQILALDGGLLASLYAAYRIASSDAPARARWAMAPWSLLIVALFAAGIWIVLQPMEMRGTLPAAG